MGSGSGRPLEVAELTRNMTSGDESAYRVFYENYCDRLWRYLLVVSKGNEQATAEALQATMVRVVRHMKPFPNDRVFWGWLSVLARTALSDQSRKHRRYLAFLDRFFWHKRVEQSVAPPQAEPDDALLALLDRNLATLPVEEQDLLEWKYTEGRSVREIAHTLNLSEKAIESRLVRIRRRLKDALLSGLKHE